MPNPTTTTALPDPLRFNDGRRVDTAQAWNAERRAEIIEQLTTQVYGRVPGRPTAMVMEVYDVDRHALGGKATRKQIAIFPFGRDAGARMDLLLYLPNHVAKPPVILGLNFRGNAAILSDPHVRLGDSFVESTERVPPALVATLSNNHLTEASRGVNHSQWPVDRMIERGYAFATAYRGDIDPDIADLADLPRGFATPWRLRPEFVREDGERPGAIAIWAWACSRAMDYLQTDPDLDASRVALFGFSRLGKVALWATATDDRFAAVICNESGSGGTKLFHHPVGEDIERLNTHFPHWFCPNYRNYIGRESMLPFDSHFAIALVAPRPIYDSTSEGYGIFDPVGEYQGLVFANPVFHLLGAQGLPDGDIPPLDQSVLGSNGFHRRTGLHDVTAFDWEQYFPFLDRALADKTE